MLECSHTDIQCADDSIGSQSSSDLVETPVAASHPTVSSSGAEQQDENPHNAGGEDHSTVPQGNLATISLPALGSLFPSIVSRERTLDGTLSPMVPVPPWPVLPGQHHTRGFNMPILAAPVGSSGVANPSYVSLPPFHSLATTPFTLEAPDAPENRATRDSRPPR